MIRLAIIEDNQLYLHALQTYLAKVPDIALVHTANDLQQLNLLWEAVPDIVIMDIDLGPDSGITGVKKIREALPGTGVLMLTVFDDEEKILQSIQAGASGYLLKKDSPKKIVEAVRTIFKGEGVINSQVTKVLLNAIPKAETPAARLDGFHLTKRETEILHLLIDGLTYKEIAARSFISMATLNTHIRNIYDKLGMHTRAEIAARFSK